MGDPRPVIPRRLATQDLRDAAARYADEVDLSTARRFIDAVEQAFTLVAGHPAIGSPRYAVELDLPGLRARPVEQFPYLIFYLEHTDHIDVLPHPPRPPRHPGQPAGPSRRHLTTSGVPEDP